MDVVLALPLLFVLPPSARTWVRFALGGIPCAAVLLLYDTICFGRPFATGYGVTGHATYFHLSNFPRHFARYVRWTAEDFRYLPSLGWVAATVSRRITPRLRGLLFSWFAAFLVAYSFYDPLDARWYLRFLLPGFPAIALGFMLLLRELASMSAAWRRPWVAAAAALAIAVMSAAGLREARRLGVLDDWKHQASFPAACLDAAERLPSDALVLSMDLSGALRYYTNLTPVRWDAFLNDDFARTRPLA
jgi:hypothetical protein